VIVIGSCNLAKHGRNYRQQRSFIFYIFDLLKIEMKKYTLNAECLHDVNKLLKSKMIGSFKMSRKSPFPDINFSFESELKIDELRNIIKTISDSHVMLRTLKFIKK
jgi:hypothetical protein